MDAKSGYFLLPGDVAGSRPVHYRSVNAALYLFGNLDACSTHILFSISPEKSWVLEWMIIYGRGIFLIRKENVAEKRCGLKNIPICVGGPYLTLFHNILLQCCWARIYAIVHIFLMFWSFPNSCELKPPPPPPRPSLFLCPSLNVL